MRSLLRRAALLLALLGATAAVQVMAQAPAQAVGSYNNAVIADKALTYVGQWGGNACADAQRVGGGQCKAFVNCIVWMASGGTQWPAPGYQSGFANAGGAEVTSATATKGDIIQVGDSDSDNPLHTAIVVANLGGGNFNVVDSNFGLPTNNETVKHHDWAPPAGARFWRMGTVVTTPPGTSDLSQTGAVRGDFNGDGRGDVAMLRDFGNNNTAVLVMNGSTSGLQGPGQVWSAGGSGLWSWDRTKMVAANFNGDGFDDVGLMYDYGGPNTNTALLIMWGSTGGLSAPGQVWSAGGAWNWDRMKIVGGDFNGNGFGDVAILYDYSGGAGTNTAMLVMWGSSAGIGAPAQIWSGVSSWNWNRIKLTAGDFNNNGSDDLAFLYNYSTTSVSNTAMLVMNGSTGGLAGPGQVWSGGSTWDWNRIKIVGGDFNGNLYDDVAFLYNYSTTSVSNTAMLVMNGSAGSLGGPGQVWSGGSAYAWDRIKLVSGDFNYSGSGNPFADVGLFYDYGSNNTAMLVMNGGAGSLGGPGQVWSAGGQGVWDWSRTKLV